MLRSSYCSLHERTNQQLTQLGECPYDQARPVLHTVPTGLQISFVWIFLEACLVVHGANIASNRWSQ